MSPKDLKIPLIWLIIAVFVVKEAAWLAVIPPSSAPDELGHYAYVEALYYEQKLPEIGSAFFSERVLKAGIGDARGADSSTYVTGSRLNWIAQHPPAYYMLLLPVFSVLPHENVVFCIFVLRFVSILLGAAAIYFTFRTLQKLLPGQDVLSSAIACAMAFLPTFSFMNAVMNNDNLVMALSAFLFYLLAVQPKADGSPGINAAASRSWSLKAGLVLALLALTKVSALPVFVTVFIIRAVYFFRAKKGMAKRSQLVNIAIVFGVPLALAAWWYVRNYFIFHNFFPGLEDAVGVNPQLLVTDPEIFTSFPEAAPHADMQLGFLDFLFAKGFLVTYFRNIWGASYQVFPNLTSLQYGFIYAFTLVGFGGWLAEAVKRHRQKALEFRKILFSDEMFSLVIVLLFLAAISWKVYDVTIARGHFGAVHGRYFFPALPAFFYLLLKGWGLVLPAKWKESAFVLFMILFALNDAGTLLYVVHGFN